MVSVDKLRGRPSVKVETLDLIEAKSVRSSPSGYPRSSLKEADAWVYLYARGYWLTRYLLGEKPDLLRRLLERRRSQHEVEDEVSKEFGVGHEEFWSGIDEVLVTHFRKTRE
jgi:hypothetical protein